MKAIKLNGFDFELKEFKTPKVGDDEILVEIKAIAINPIDIKMRNLENRPTTDIIGWDASGIVKEVGSEDSKFKVGDGVFYAGSLIKDGAYASHQVVDESLVASKPSNLTFTQSSALPLTSLTAYEALYEKLDVKEGRTILIINGAGGVGSIAILMAKNSKLRTIASSSRKESKEFCKSLGADYVLDHSKPLKEELHNIGIDGVDYILNCHDTYNYFDVCCDLIKLDGKICALTDSKESVDINLLKKKRGTFMFEFMFSKSLFNENGYFKPQGEILKEVADLVQRGIFKTTLKTTLKGFSVDSIEKAHKLIKSGNTIGKIAIEF